VDTHTIVRAPQPGEVLVYLCDLTHCNADDERHHRSLLSPDEQKRNDRLGHTSLRSHDAHCRGLLRRHLGAILTTDPAQVALTTADEGKPVLADTSPAVHFNLSHSGNQLALALRGDGAVGVDLERIATHRDVDALARRFFAEEEANALATLLPAARIAHFYALWTLKEASLKARGKGLSGGLASPRFTLADTGEGQSLTVSGCKTDTPEPDWYFSLPSAPCGYRLAIAAPDAADGRTTVASSPLTRAASIP
jgi:4'-phosphopantetheinyl transferase